MSQEGKREWQAAAKASRAQPVQAAQGPAPRRQDPVAPWPHCGDTFYPMKEELVQGVLDSGPISSEGASNLPPLSEIARLCTSFKPGVGLSVDLIGSELFKAAPRQIT